MREVGVHLDQHVVAAGEAHDEAGAVRRAEPGLAAAAQDIDRAELDVELLGAIGGAVGTAVVDYEDVGVGQRLTRTPENVLDVLDLVVRGQHHEDAHLRRAYRRPFSRACREQLLHGHTIGA